MHILNMGVPALADITSRCQRILESESYEKAANTRIEQGKFANFEPLCVVALTIRMCRQIEARVMDGYEKNTYEDAMLEPLDVFRHTTHIVMACYSSHR